MLAVDPIETIIPIEGGYAFQWRMGYSIQEVQCSTAEITRAVEADWIDFFV